MNYRACALTGHRELPAEFDLNAVYDALEELLRGGCHAFYCGMARGFDLAALHCLRDLRGKYAFTVEACIPYRGQERGFHGAARREYDALLVFCDKKTVLSEEFFAGCLLARDRYMVDRADVVLAYLHAETGGTAYTVRYAQKRGVEVRFL